MKISKKFLCQEAKKIRKKGLYVGLNETPKSMSKYFVGKCPWEKYKYVAYYSSSYVSKNNICSIRILNSISNYTKLLALYHELAHHICFIKSCTCVKKMRKNNFLATEIHAILATLRYLLDINRNDLLLEEMSFIASCLKSDKKYDDVYWKAANKIIEDKLWATCINRVGKTKLLNYLKKDGYKIKIIKSKSHFHYPSISKFLAK